MKKKYYKVVINHGQCVGGDRLMSANSLLCNTVVYELGKWTKAPRNTRLFVFDDEKAAIRFANRRTHEVYECEIIGGIRGRGCFHEVYQERFWGKVNSLLKKKKKINFNDIHKNLELYPVESILAKKVKLRKRIN
jgi:hypothetical protein